MEILFNKLILLTRIEGKLNVVIKPDYNIPCEFDLIFDYGLREKQKQEDRYREIFKYYNLTINSRILFKNSI